MNQCEIRPNNCAANESCAFCGERTDPGVPLAIFKAGTYQSVCDLCAKKYAPDATAALDLFYEAMGREADAVQEDARGKMTGALTEISAGISRILPLFTLRRHKQAAVELSELQKGIEKRSLDVWRETPICGSGGTSAKDVLPLIYHALHQLETGHESKGAVELRELIEGIEGNRPLWDNELPFM